MIQENETHSWLASGWSVVERLNVLSVNLRNLELSNTMSQNFENFTKNNINELVSLDKSIFDPYWQNSEAAFIETLDSCNQNYLFKQYDEDLLVGYAILGVTRNFSFLQRFGISLGYQNKGHGSELLKYVLNFAKDNKFTNIKSVYDTIHEDTLYRRAGRSGVGLAMAYACAGKRLYKGDCGCGR